MKIAENIEVLELQRPGGDLLHLTVVHDADSVVLVDTGLPGQYEDVMQLIGQAGIGADGPDTIILTHQDIDHIGGLPSFLTVYGQPVDVYAHEGDRPVIDGEEPWLKVPAERLASILDRLPEEKRRQFEMIFSASTPSNVDRLLTDRETLPFAGGLTVIHTPGHTPGHISLYHAPSKTLIAGDAMIVQEGELLGPNPAFTPDMPLAIRSLDKLTKYDIRTVICYHGGVYSRNPNERIAELAASRSAQH